MTPISRPQLQAVNGSGCGDQGASQFDTVAFRKQPQVVAGTPPDFQVDRNALITAKRSSRISCSRERAPCQSSATVTGEHTSTAWLRARLSHFATRPASRPRNLDQNVRVNQNRPHNAILDSRLPLRSRRTYFLVSGRSLRSRQMPTRACIALLRLAGELP